MARLTSVGKCSEQPFTDAFAGHLNETEFRDVEHLGSSLVSRECPAECIDHLAAVLLDLHVDEVDHDDAADVS